MFKSIKNFIIDSFRKPTKVVEKVNVQELINSIHPIPNTLETDSPFIVNTALLTKNEFDRVAKLYTGNDIIPDVSELAEILISRSKIAYAAASASESLRYVAGVQPINLPTGQVFYLTRSDEGITLKSMAVLAELVGTTKVPTNEVDENSIDVPLSSLLPPPIRANLQSLVNQVETLGHNVVRDGVKALLHNITPSKSVEDASKEIKQYTRRGKASFILVNKKGLEKLSKVYDVASCGRSQEGFQYIHEVGCINDLDVNVFLFDDEILDNEVIVGYKGGNGECDAGLFVSPFASTTYGTYPSILAYRVGLIKQPNGASYYRSVKLSSIKKPRTKNLIESPVVESP